MTEWTVTTTKGLLEKRTGGVDDDNETTTWVEYWLDGELIHRSADIALKRGVFAIGVAADLGG